MCFVEIFAAGPRAVEQIDSAVDTFQGFVSAALEGMPERRGMPPEVVRAMIGGLRKVIHTRLYRGEEEELVELTPQMWDWGLSYMPPPEPLRRPRTKPPAKPATRGL